MENEHPLNTSWTLWYHIPNDKNWSKDSYKRIMDIKTIEDYWTIHNNLKPKHLENGMFFLMRDNIFPLWEDTHNINGGCWSFKIDKKKIYNTWIELSISLLGENLTNDINNSNNINGITVSPKKGFCILKIWNSDKKKSNTSLIKNNIPNISLKECIYKSHT